MDDWLFSTVVISQHPRTTIKPSPIHWAIISNFDQVHTLYDGFFMLSNRLNRDYIVLGLSVCLFVRLSTDINILAINLGQGSVHVCYAYSLDQTPSDSSNVDHHVTLTLLFRITSSAAWCSTKKNVFLFNILYFLKVDTI